MEKRPYVLIKDRATLSVVDLKNKKATIVVQNCPFRWDSTRDYNIDVEMSGNGKYLDVFTIEGEQRE
jgi:hypothetical protein